MQPGGVVQPQSCVKCGAPVGTSGGRCPFCGTEQPKVQSMRPADVATVGLTDVNRASMGRPPLRKQQKSNVGTIVAIGVTVVLFVGAGSAFWVIKNREAALASVQASVSALPPPPPKQIAITTMAGLPIVDATKVDPTDLLPKAKRQVTAWDKDAKLLEIAVTGAKNGAVDVTQAGAEVIVRYVGTTTVADPRAPKLAPVPERMTFTLKAGGPAEPEKGAGEKADKGIGEPTCVWSAAWRAAKAAGLPADGAVDARFGLVPKRDNPVWTFTAGGATQTINGSSCAIEVK